MSYNGVIYGREALINSDWLAELANSRNQIAIERFGLSRVSPNWQLRSRKIGEHYLTYVISESNTVKLEGKPHRLPPHSLVYIAPEYPHDMKPQSVDSPHTFYHLRFKIIKKRKNIIPGIQYNIINNAHYLLPLVEQMYSENHQPQALSAIRFRALLTAVMCAVLQKQCSLQNTEMPPRVLSPQQQRLCINYVLENLRCPIHPQELAGLLGYSHDYFTRIFRNSTGYAPRSWVMRQRMKQATFLLEDATMPISQIAMEVGCEDVFRFSKQFKQVYGKSPSEFRDSIK